MELDLFRFLQDNLARHQFKPMLIQASARAWNELSKLPQAIAPLGGVYPHGINHFQMFGMEVEVDPELEENEIVLVPAEDAKLYRLWKKVPKERRPSFSIFKRIQGAAR